METTRLRLRVAPGAGRTEIVGRYGDAWKLRVTGAPERGRANAAVLRLLAETLDLPEDDLVLVSGHASRDKVVELHGLDGDEAERRLEAAHHANGPRTRRPSAGIYPGTHVEA